MRCDKSMKRSKERGYRPSGIKWKCDGNCRECICALFMQEDGTEIHKKLDRSHKARIYDDEFETEREEV